MGPSVYAPDLKADWRDLGGEIRQQIQTHPGREFRVIVKSPDPARNVEVETARYYLPGECQVIAWNDFRTGSTPSSSEPMTYVAMCVKPGANPPSPDEPAWEISGRFPGLVVYRVDRPAGP